MRVKPLTVIKWGAGLFVAWKVLQAYEASRRALDRLTPRAPWELPPGGDGGPNDMDDWDAWTNEGTAL